MESRHNLFVSFCFFLLCFFKIHFSDLKKKGNFYFVFKHLKAQVHLYCCKSQHPFILKTSTPHNLPGRLPLETRAWDWSSSHLGRSGSTDKTNQTLWLPSKVSFVPLNWKVFLQIEHELLRLPVYFTSRNTVIIARTKGLYQKTNKIPTWILHA